MRKLFSILIPLCITFALTACTGPSSTDTRQSLQTEESSDELQKFGEEIDADSFLIAVLGAQSVENNADSENTGLTYRIDYRVTNISSHVIDTCDFPEPIVSTHMGWEGQPIPAPQNGGPEFQCGMLEPGVTVERSVEVLGPEEELHILVFAPDQSTLSYRLYGVYA